MTELKYCPSCGAKKIRIDTFKEDPIIYYYCLECYLSLTSDDKIEEKMMDLKSCPLCGNSNIELIFDIPVGHIRCRQCNCGFDFESRFNTIPSIKKWNTRHGENND